MPDLTIIFLHLPLNARNYINHHFADDSYSRWRHFSSPPISSTQTEKKTKQNKNYNNKPTEMIFACSVDFHNDCVLRLGPTNNDNYLLCTRWLAACRIYSTLTPHLPPHRQTFTHLTHRQQQTPQRTCLIAMPPISHE